jgi:RNA polymerase sigma factor (sigma-70 family)
MQTDAELLQLYAKRGSDEAFTALVQRHLPVIYSAALRQVSGDSHRAEEVVQTVFTLLARKARQLRDHPALLGWLYTTTHYTATKLRHAEQRRSRVEIPGGNVNENLEQPDARVDWDLARPVIDEVMVQLKEHDRLAILLRFFADKSYAEIGAQIGLSENAARMRVDRALDAIRTALSRRGIASTSAALATVLAAQAIGAVPEGLAATITVGALSSAGTGGALLFMSSTFYKATAVSAVVLAGATGLVLQHREIGRLRTQNERLIALLNSEQHASSMANKSARHASADAVTPEILRLQAQVAQLKSGAASSWEQRVAMLKDVIKELPEQSIPELQLATDEDWLDATKGKLETADDYRRALGKLRNLAVSRFTRLASPALQKYLKEHNGQFPTLPSDLQSYLEKPIDDAIWKRWTVAPAETVSNLGMGEGMIITQDQVVDPDYDYQVVMGRRGTGSTTYHVSDMMKMDKAWRDANPGQPAPSLEQLRPFATTQKQKDILERAIAREHKSPVATDE